MKIPFKSMRIKRFGRAGGVTLPEVLVAVSIFSVIVVPFLGTFLSATNNNIASKDKLYSSAMSQRAMDDIKARPLLLEDRAGKGEALYQDEDMYRIYYRIDEINRHDLPESSDQYDLNLNNILMCQEFIVDSTSVSLDGSAYSLASGGVPEKYNLVIKKNVTNYNYELYKGNIIQRTGGIFPDAEINIKISFTEEGTHKLELYVNIDPSVDKNVNFYIVDDNDERLVLINNGDKSFTRNDAISGQVQYSDVLYKVEITVYKGEDAVNRLVSFVNK
ncbi:MAG TPA: prepilin-type N-terminal cleavage/methylation domain-containing protein [Pseudobacteroides sp.]|uniref:type IV pilus modification PilV family protein n=1 Tax=Pseudobacteroides sp. TaxID=1968840 RepID=UPI002F926780